MTSALDVIVATNRSSPFLEEALAAVVAQKEVTCNIILVDDGSPDPEFLRACTAKIARAVVIRQSHAGPSAARNRGLREGAAPFVAFLDDDDVWHPLKAQKQIEALEQEPEAVACFCWGWYVDGSGAIMGSWLPATVAASADVIRGAAPLPRIVTVVVRREACIEVGGFNETYRRCEDQEFMFRLLLRGEFVAVADKLVGYRMHNGNRSGWGRHEAIAALDTMFLDLEKLCTQGGDARRAALFQENRAMHRGDAWMTCLRELRAAIGMRSRSNAAKEAEWLVRHAGWLGRGMQRVGPMMRARKR